MLPHFPAGDMIADDGVYTGYLSGLPGDGSYELIVAAENDHRDAEHMFELLPGVTSKE